MSIRFRLLAVILPIFTASLAFGQVADKRLLQKTSVKFEAKPLRAALEELCEKYKLTLNIDQKSLQDEGITDDTSITLDLDSVTLESSIYWITTSAGRVAYYVEKGTLFVMTETTADERLMTVTYPLAGLGALTNDFQQLSLAVQQCNSGQWLDVDGVGGKYVNYSPQSLTIEHTRQVHGEITDTLERAAAVMSGKRRNPSAIERNEDLIRRALARPSQLPAGDRTFSELVAELKKTLKCPIVIHQNSLQDEGIQPENTTITIDKKKQSLGQTLQEALTSAELAWRIDHEAFVIVTKVLADETHFTRLYDARRRNRSAQDLADQIVLSKELGPWQEVDGVGGSATAVGPLIFVRTSAAVHEKLVALIGPGE